MATLKSLTLIYKFRMTNLEVLSGTKRIDECRQKPFRNMRSSYCIEHGSIDENKKNGILRILSNL